MGAGRVTRWTRVALAGQVVALLALVLAAVLLVVEVAQAPSARVRVDLTFDDSSSLDPTTLGVLESLPAKAEVDLFYRPVAIGGEALRDAIVRMRALLELAQEQVPGALSVRVHDANDLTRSRARMEEIRVTADDLSFETGAGTWLAAMVVKVGERRTVARVVPDICMVDLSGGSGGIGGRIVRWRGEEALAEALGRVSGERPPRVVFAQGAGELAPVPAQQGGFGSLASALGNEGFEVELWDLATEPEVPAGTDVLVLPGPQRALTPGAQEAVERFVFDGGSLLLTTGRDQYVRSEGGVPALAERFGLRIPVGIVCRQVWNPTIREWVTGLPECAVQEILTSNLAATHPITEPLRSGQGLVARFTLPLAVERGEVPSGGTFVGLVHTGDRSWRDLPRRNAADVLFRFESDRERYARYALMGATEWTGPSGDPSRVVALGTPDPISVEFEFNRDLVLNAFEWLAERDYLVRLRPRRDLDARIPPNRTGLTSAVRWTGWLGFPVLCLVVGGLLAWSRRRS